MVEPYLDLVASVRERISADDADGLVRLGMRLGEEGPDGYLWLWALGESYGVQSLVRLSAYFCASAPEDHWGIPLLTFGLLSNGDALGGDCPDGVNTRINVCTAIQAIALERGFQLVAPFVGWFLSDLLEDRQPEPARSAFETLDILKRYDVLPLVAVSETADAICTALQRFKPLDDDEAGRREDLSQLLALLAKMDVVDKAIPRPDEGEVSRGVDAWEAAAPPQLRGVLSNLLSDAQRYADSHNLAVQKHGYVLEGRISWLPSFNPLASFQRFISVLETMMNGGEVLSTAVATGSLVIRVCGAAPPRGLHALAGPLDAKTVFPAADVLKRVSPLLTEVVDANIELDLRSASPAGRFRPIRWTPEPEDARALAAEAAKESIETETARLLVELVAADSQSGRAILLPVQEGAERANAKAPNTNLLRGRTIGQRYWITAEIRRTQSIAHGERTEYLISEISRSKQEDHDEDLVLSEATFPTHRIPQSVKPSRLVTWVRVTAAKGRPATSTDIGLQSDRSSYYYRRGAEALELLSPGGALTMAGRLVANTKSDEDALDRMAECFANSHLAQLLMEFAEVDDFKDITLAHARPFVEHLSSAGLEGTTIESRAGTIRSWIRSFKPRIP